ncbi:MAG TPA: TlpA disulfide reductase family protein [Pirellulales bacterium]|nr:TlpA disulfide reductase family protein [Pirellulales bacterium]
MTFVKSNFGHTRHLALAFALALTCVTPSNGDEPAQDASAKRGSFSVLLIDSDGKPVEGADVGYPASLGETARDAAKRDGTEWEYGNHQRSNDTGVATFPELPEPASPFAIVARHEKRKLIAIASVDWGKVDGPVRMTLLPEREVVGRWTCEELAALGRDLEHEGRAGLVEIDFFVGKRFAIALAFADPEFRLALPPGEYKLSAKAGLTHFVEKTFTVTSQSGVQQLATFNLPATRATLLEGHPAPEIPDVVAWKNGPAVKLSELRGQVVLLEFWGYWCGSCVYRMPDLFAAHDKYHDCGLTIIGVHTDLGVDEEEPVDTVERLDGRLTSTRKELWKGRDLPFRVALVRGDSTSYGEGIDHEARSTAAAAYGIVGYPSCVLIDRRGIVVAPHWAPNEAGIALLEKVLAEE